MGLRLWGLSGRVPAPNRTDPLSNAVKADYAAVPCFSVGDAKSSEGYVQDVPGICTYIYICMYIYICAYILSMCILGKYGNPESAVNGLVS